MQKRQNSKIIFYAILVLIWMGTIFYFSNQNGDESQGTSNVITNKVVGISRDYFGINVNSKMADNISFIVRKIAHFSIYFLGGILIYNFVNMFSIKKRYIIIVSVILGVGYACFDELHQLFIDGRSAQLRDVLIDSCGLVIAIIIRNNIKIEEEKWKN